MDHRTTIPLLPGPPQYEARVSIRTNFRIEQDFGVEAYMPSLGDNYNARMKAFL